MDLPEEDELVLITVKKIIQYGAFCILPEYENKEAFLHISEVAPRWIKNIHEFLSEGQRSVAKVIHIDQEKGQIDVSLKRVSEKEKQMKLEAVKKETRGEKLFEFIVSEAKTDANELKQKILDKYGTLYDFFETVSYGDHTFLDELPKRLASLIVEISEKNIKKPKYSLSKTISLKCYRSDGVEVIKDVLAKIKAQHVTISYLGAPKYRITITDENHKKTEKRMDNILEIIEKETAGKECVYLFED